MAKKTAVQDAKRVEAGKAFPGHVANLRSQVTTLKSTLAAVAALKAAILADTTTFDVGDDAEPSVVVGASAALTTALNAFLAAIASV